MFWITLAGSLLLIAMGIIFSIDHEGAAKAYGVPTSGGTENAWISSAALRDLAYGCLTLTFVLLRDRRAVGALPIVRGNHPRRRCPRSTAQQPSPT